MSAIRPTRTWAFAFAALFAAAVLAGCAQRQETREDNAPPVAAIEASKRRGFSTESFSFSAEESNDPDGQITRVLFDFGDGTKQEMDFRQNQEADHIFTRGGEFTVTVTVFDDGGQDSGSLSDAASVKVGVNERRAVAGQTIFAGPNNSTATFREAFQVFEDADRVELDARIQSSVLVGSSQITVRLLDPSNRTLDEETRTVNQGQFETVNLRSNLDREGRHVMEITARSGGATVSGELRVYYDENL